MHIEHYGTDLLCPCGYDNLHLVAHLEFMRGDDYQTTGVRVNGDYEIHFQRPIRYPYRTQGNIHLLFAGECDHYSAKSFDGHKGYVVLDGNGLIAGLCEYLNSKSIGAEGGLELCFSYALLADIERFFNFYQIEEEK